MLGCILQVTTLASSSSALTSAASLSVDISEAPVSSNWAAPRLGVPAPVANPPARGGNGSGGDYAWTVLKEGAAVLRAQWEERIDAWRAIEEANAARCRSVADGMWRRVAGGVWEMPRWT